jgi:lysozyme
MARGENRGITGLLAIGVAAYFLLRSSPAQAMTDVAEQDTSNTPKPSENNADVTPNIWDNLNIPLPNMIDNTWDNPNTPLPDMSNPSKNLSAFLFMIRSTEHRYPQDVLNDAAYNIFYGGARFKDMTDHPVLTGELKGVPLPDHICAASGLSAGCVSTAAGAYQIIKPTWNRVRNIEPKLLDFSPASQDEAAIRILKEGGVLPYIESGDIDTAIKKSSKIWASLPYSQAQQNPKQLAYATDRFAEGLAQA